MATLGGRRFGRLFPMSRTAIAVDLHPHNGAYLFIDVAARWRSVYLIVRKLKILERESVNPTAFQLRLRQALSGFELKDAFAADEGMVFRFEDASGHRLNLYAAVNAKPSNLVLYDEKFDPISAAKDDAEAEAPKDLRAVTLKTIVSEEESLSSELDKKRIAAETESRFQIASSEVRKNVTRRIAKRQKLLTNLNGDLEKHGDAEKLKRFGDLILASLPNPKREGDNFRLVDLFDVDQPEILIPATDDSPKAVADKYYRAYRKAINAKDVIASRKAEIMREIDDLVDTLAKIELAIERKDIDAITAFQKPRELVVEKSKKEKSGTVLKGVRRFASSDGFEILVGKKATDNDTLTFRLARSLDTWLHAADYPGSHVVIRNPNRKPIPQSTMIEAASLAAFYSDARELPKAAVNYTQRKFVNKPKRAAPGLVSLTSFKTMLVRPAVPDTVEKADL